jgi:RimJ/RimL family protein N-acetyltransferase
MKIELVLYDLGFLKLSWTWLNNPEIKTLTNTPDFSKEDQNKWFENLKNNAQYLIWGITADDIPIGVAGLKRITQTDAYVFWYIGDKNYWGKGIGDFVASEMSRKGRDLKLKYLYAESVIENFRSINLLFKEGYKITQFEKTLYVFKKIL